MKANSKAFIEAMKIFGSTPEKAKEYLEDMRLTAQEKTILKCRFALRDTKFDEIIDQLSGMVCQDQFIESQRLMILGSAYNNKGDLTKAIPLCEKSLILGKPYGIRQNDFLIRFSLFMIHMNMQNKREMQKVYKELKAMGITNDFETIGLLSAQYHISIDCEDLETAQDSIEELGMKMSVMTEGQIFNFFLIKFEYALVTDDMKKADETLLEMLKYRKYRSGANFKFMRFLLDHYMKGTALYAYEKHFHDHPYLNYQIHVIKLLEETKEAEATKYWKKLQEISPEIYLDNFKYAGKKCIFSLCIEKHLASTKVEIKEFAVGTNKEEILFHLLSTTKVPLSKEKIFEILYGKLPESKADFYKLSTMIYSLKKKRNIEIKSKKGCYLLVA